MVRKMFEPLKFYCRYIDRYNSNKYKLVNIVKLYPWSRRIFFYSIFQLSTKSGQNNPPKLGRNHPLVKSGWKGTGPKRSGRWTWKGIKRLVTVLYCILWGKQLNSSTTEEQTTKFSSANFQTKFNLSYIILRIQRLEGKPCRSWWGGSLWATSSSSTLFANSAIFVTGS